jgi:hypothetical protein
MNKNLNLDELTKTERDAILMVNAYGVDVAVKVAKNQEKFYQHNPDESVYWKQVIGHLLGIQTHKFAY